MNKRLITSFCIAAIPLVLTVYTSCKRNTTSFRDTCEGVIQPNPYYRITSVSTIMTDTNLREITNFGPRSYNEIWQFVKADKTEPVASRKINTKGSFFSEAYACSPIPAVNINGIANITLIFKERITYRSDNDSIRLNDTITDRFVIRDSIGFINVSDYFIKHKPVKNTALVFKLKDQPYQPVRVKYQSIITLSDGKILTLADNTLYVK